MNDVIYSKKARETIINTCSVKGIEFKFIPPRSPHFGGLWEAAVKSAKHLLLKNASTANLTYEEFETIVVEVEAMLNSRPLVPIPSHPDDLNALTPGHALIGELLTSSVDVHSLPGHGKMLDRWRQVSEIKHQFWRRWSTEYLNELQHRHKWKGPTTDVQLDTLVILKEDNLPVMQWPLGRIVKVYKGDDGIVRVCDVKTQKGVFKRALHILAPLFPEDHTKNQDVRQRGNKKTSELGPENSKDPPEEPSSKKPSLVVSIPLNRLRKAPPFNDIPSKKPCQLHPNMLITLIMLFLLPLALCSPINITQFSSRPGIFFEQIGGVKLSTTNWNIVAYYDLVPYRNELEFLKRGNMNLRWLCDQTTDNTACYSLASYFEDV